MDLTISTMRLLSLCLFLAFLTGALGSLVQSSPLPKPSTSGPSPISPTRAYVEALTYPLSTRVLISSSTTLQTQSQIKQATATPTPGVLLPPFPPPYLTPLNSSISLPMENSTNSTIAALSSPGISSTAHQQSLTMPTIPVPTHPPNVPPPIGNYCSYEYLYSCQTSYPIGCRCDRQCKMFGDCCADSGYVQDTDIPNFDCVPNIVLIERIDKESESYYWMIASCPKGISDSELNGLADLCEEQSLSSPPISDNRTGLVYRNMYCAQCHGVPEKEHVAWPSQWHCNDSFLNAFFSSRGTVDLEVILAFCYATVFVPPEGMNEKDRPPFLPMNDKDRPYLARECDGSIIYECQPLSETNTSSKEYHSLEKRCQKEPGKARTISTAPGRVYKNEYCALCSSSSMDSRNLECPPDKLPPLTNHSSDSTRPFILLLDVTGSGVEALGTINIDKGSTIQQSCAVGHVFDVYKKACRESYCQPGYSEIGTSCLPTDPNCTLITLNATEYDTVTDQIIFWMALEQNVSIQGYNSDGDPLVCTNFTSTFNTTVNETITQTLYGYPEALTILSYLGLSIDVVAAAILLFTYVAFAEMRTFYGKLFMNFVLVLLLGDLTFLLGPAVYTVSLEDVVCQVVAILLHYLFLARFVWMSLLSLNVARHFYHAMKFIVSEESESWHYLILYMAAGWLSPLLVLIVTVPVNYVIPGSVSYGVDGLCWMDETLAIIMSFIAPLAICILFATATFVFVCIILVKWHSSDVQMDKNHKTSSRNCRVLFAVFGITGATWMFGFLAIIDSALSWAWYLFIILNTTQAVFLAMAYVCTAKVLRLYRSAFRKTYRICRRRCCYKLHKAQQQTQLELMKQSMRSNNISNL